MSSYTVDVLPEPEELPAEHRERFRVCLERRLGKLTTAGKPPVVGGAVDILDAFDGPYVWEMTPEQLEATPPTQIWFTVVSMEPAGDSTKVTVRIDT